MANITIPSAITFHNERWRVMASLMASVIRTNDQMFAELADFEASIAGAAGADVFKDLQNPDDDRLPLTKTNWEEFKDAMATLKTAYDTNNVRARILHSAVKSTPAF